jgi:streptogrisin D
MKRTTVAFAAAALVLPLASVAAQGSANASSAAAACASRSLASSALSSPARVALAPAETSTPELKGNDGVPTRLLSGILGSVTTETGSVVVVADASKVDLGVLKSRVTSGLSASDASLVSVEPSCTSSDALVTAWRRVFARDWAANAPKLAFGMFLDARTEKIVVETDTTAAGPSTISSLEAVAPGLITITSGGASRLDRLNDTLNGGHWGGAGIGNSSGGTRVCTSAFTAKKSNGVRVSITAGHCGANGTKWWSGSYSYGTTAGFANFPDYDQERIEGSTYGNKIWTDGPGDGLDSRTVTGGGDAAQNTQVCASGMISRSICGITVVDDNGGTFCDYQGCTTYLMVGYKGGAVIGQGGDSGGPIYSVPSGSNATIRGMIIGGTGGGVHLYAERYNSIAGHLGITVATS